MRALVTIGAPPWIALAAVEPPEPAANEALVAVAAVSLNRGELDDLPQKPRGLVPGWDFAGVVERAAADGSGPAAGVRVTGLVRAGAWAERVAAATANIAVVPAAVSDAQAAALPTAALTALRSLEIGGLVLGKRVLVTGATGGVGQFAVQLARLAGADVTAHVRSTGAELDGDYDVIVEAVGGAVFSAAIEHLRPGGVVVNLATGSDDEVVSFRATAFDRSAGARIYTYNLFAEAIAAGGVRGDLERLLTLVARGALDVPIGLETGWEDAERALAALRERTFGGKAVLRVAG